MSTDDGPGIALLEGKIRKQGWRYIYKVDKNNKMVPIIPKDKRKEKGRPVMRLQIKSIT